ncbi:MAG: type II secretion system F family protein [Planctomycetes bacterium]|nr:type II secretion system F family protein [Planctomycetota bacterium]
MADSRINLYHNLSVLLDAGVPITRALQSVSKTGRYGRLFKTIQEQVAAGNSLSDAINQYPRQFDKLDQTLIHVGQETGQLAEMLEELSRWYSFRQRLNRTMRSGMLFSILMIHLLAFIAPVVPFALSGFDWSLYIQGILGILAIFYIPALIILAIVFLTAKCGPLRWMWDAFVIRMPLLGKAIRELELSRYSKIFSITYKAGVPITRCIEMATDVVGNQIMRRRLCGACDKVAQGEEMAAGFSRSLPREFICVWEVGEESGELDESARRLGNMHADNTEMRFSLIAQWTPRIIYAIVACVMIYYIFTGYSQIYGNLSL